MRDIRAIARVHLAVGLIVPSHALRLAHAPPPTPIPSSASSRSRQQQLCSTPTGSRSTTLKRSLLYCCNHFKDSWSREETHWMVGTEIFFSSSVVIVARRWCVCSAFNTTIITWYSICCGSRCSLHSRLLPKVQHDIEDFCSSDYLIVSKFPSFRKHIEPDLHHAQIWINNSFVCSFCSV